MLANRDIPSYKNILGFDYTKLSGFVTKHIQFTGPIPPNIKVSLKPSQNLYVLSKNGSRVGEVQRSEFEVRSTFTTQS